MVTKRGTIQAEKLRTWDAWRDVHQPFELDWWRTALENGHSIEDAGFYAHWDPVRQFINPQSLIIDIGSGPRPPFAPCVVIDPLADEYRKLPTVKPEWWKDVMVAAMPAETQIFHLIGKAKTVICWNCLDHTIGWRSILDNILSYGEEQDARFAVATDFYAPFVGHPGFDRAEFMAEISKRFEIIEAREPFDRQLALLMKAK